MGPFDTPTVTPGGPPGGELTRIAQDAVLAAAYITYVCGEDEDRRRRALATGGGAAGLRSTV